MHISGPENATQLLRPRLSYIAGAASSDYYYFFRKKKIEIIFFIMSWFKLPVNVAPSIAANIEGISMSQSPKVYYSICHEIKSAWVLVLLDLYVEACESSYHDSCPHLYCHLDVSAAS